MPAPSPEKALSRRFVFVLMPEFTLLSFAGALDALRLANRQLGFEAYSWRLLGEGGGTAEAAPGKPEVQDGASTGAT